MATNIVGATGIDKVQDGIIVNADIDTVAASKLTGALPAISGASLTNLPADATKLPLAGGTLTGNLAFNLDGIVSSTAGFMQLKAEDSMYLHYDTDGGGGENLVVRSGSSATERMRIDSAGRVAIGSYTPDVLLSNIGSGIAQNIGANGIYWNSSEASKYVAQFRNGSDPAWGIAIKLGISSPDATDKYISFIDDQGTIQASLTGVGHATGGLGFQTSGSTQMTIDYEGSTTWGTWGYSNNSVYINVGGKRAIYMGVDTTASTNRIRFANANGYVGGISTSGSATAFNTSSDYRLKENVDYTWDATTRLKQLKPARFNFKTDASTTMEGFLAHEVSSIIPEAVSGDKDAMKEILYTADDVETQGESPTKAVGDFKEFHSTEIDPQGIDQSKLVPLLVKTIQELEARLTAGGL